MTIEPATILDDADWEVPAHEVAIYGPRRHAHALVIPVINEGERIRGQLARIQAAGLPVDVIVADGGSTDGSLDPGFVAGAGVRAVLTKTGPGKLSAQLRMAYAWCLRQGYAGIVTIDGNGKDGVEAVATMVARLEEGCDYVQGSRYLPGGLAENTPLERTIANRAIHAPLLSLAGRHWFTDTTNGFRAYSARYLRHPDVRPFREVFSVYNLLFYLTVRAGQLGLKVAHVPVARRYPEDGKVPTKIGGFGSKLALLKETFIAATGGYTPDAAGTGRGGWNWPIAVLAALLVPLLLAVMASPPYSADSWALYELSQSVFGDFYRFTHFRSYASDVPYSASFPPLTPVLIACVDAALGTGPRTGLYLAFVSFAAFALVSEAIGRKAAGAAWIGLGAALVLLLGPNMLLIEMNAGRTIPLQMLLYAVILLGILDARQIGFAQAAVIGFVTGLAVLNRFDAVLLPLPIALAVAWLTRSAARGLAVLAAAAVTVSPWLFWSYATFGTIYAADNAGIAAALDPRAYVTDWWPGPQPGFADDPLAWATKIAGNLGGLAHVAAGLVVSPLGLAAAAFLAPAAGLALLARPHLHLGSRPGILVGAAVLAGAMLAPQIVTGYTEQRYLSAAIWTTLLAVSCWGTAQALSLHQRTIFGRFAGAVAVLAVAALAAAQAPAMARAGEAEVWSQFEAPADVRALRDCVADSPGSRILVLGDERFAARAGALGGLATMMVPRNMREGRLDAAASRAFLATWKVDFVLAADPAQGVRARTSLPLVKVPGCTLPLYRVATGSLDPVASPSVTSPRARP